MRERPEVFRKYDIRGEVPEEINSDLVFKVGKALGSYWNSGNICIGRDGRENSPELYRAAISGLREQGCDVTPLGISTTDMVGLATKENFDAGIMITASHMPSEYGGIKPLNSQGRILSNEEMADIKDIYLRKETEQIKGGEERKELHFVDNYKLELLERYRKLFNRELEELKVVVDPSNAVGSIAAPEVLENLGAEVIQINSELDPDFPSHSPEPHEESAEQLSEKVIEENADLGIIFDGDADRVMFVDEKGKFLPGDTALGIFSEKYLELSSKIVLSINTSNEIIKFIEDSGGDIIFTPPGAVFTALECLKNDTIFGGQPNGHLMDTEFVPYDSGTLFSILMAGILSEEGRKLSEIRKKFEELEKERLNLQTPRKKEKIEEIREKAESEGILKLEEFNSLTLNFGDLNVFLRPSGSEDLIRVKVEAEKITEESLQELRDYLNT